MCVKFSSAGGWLFEKGVIVRGGIVPERDCGKLVEGRTHDAVVYAIRDKKADVGTVRTNILESMQREGKIDMKDFTIIHPMKHPDFSEVCSTPLYPDWPFASLSKSPPEVTEKLKKRSPRDGAGQSCAGTGKASRTLHSRARLSAARGFDALSPRGPVPLAWSEVG